MRVTQSMLNRNSLAAINRNFDQLGKLNEQLSSGKRVNTVSDDLLATRDIMRFKRENAQLEIYVENTKRTDSALSYASSNLQQGSEILTRVKELAVQGATGTYNSAQRETMASGVNTLLESLTSLSNTKHQGRSLFGGQATDEIPFKAERDTEGNITAINYNGSLATTNVRISPGIESELNFNGRDIFQGEVDIFQTLIDLRDALRADDTEAINNSIGELDSAQKNLNRHLGHIGEKTAQLDVVFNTLEKLKSMNKMFQSESQDADVAELSVEYNNMLALMQIVFNVASKTSQMPTLAHFL